MPQSLTQIIEKLNEFRIRFFSVTTTTLGFCGSSTYGRCSSNANCTTGGCSGQVCQSRTEESVVTTCEWRECFDETKYGLSCKCVSGGCKWS
ncbi:eight-cysteine-cluster domain-containing protein [Candidatus Micrarchaeota archaeon]|nr:eight-cysteine-cluster domain-containing protein [Candidatus Micrarchaeota archaeon]